MFRSCSNLAASSSLEIVLYILVSSANNFTVDFSRAGKSFMYSKNSIGESSASMLSLAIYIGPMSVLQPLLKAELVDLY